MDVLKRHNVTISGASSGTATGTKTVMFAHGYGCDKNMWRHVAPAFEKEYRVVLYDLAGVGGSDPAAYNSQRYSLLQAYADDVLEIADALKITEMIFVGHSVSSMIGALAARKAPALISHLIMIGPSPRYMNDGDYVGGFEKSDIDELLVSLSSNYLGWSSTMAPVIMGNADRPELADELKNSFCRMDPEIAKNFARVTFLSDNRSDLDGIRAKTLILQCSDDVIAPNIVGEYVQKRVAGSRLVVLKATGHCPNLSAPDETTREIKKFLHA